MKRIMDRITFGQTKTLVSLYQRGKLKTLREIRAAGLGVGIPYTTAALIAALIEEFDLNKPRICYTFNRLYEITYLEAPLSIRKPSIGVKKNNISRCGKFRLVKTTKSKDCKVSTRYGASLNISLPESKYIEVQKHLNNLIAL